MPPGCTGRGSHQSASNETVSEWNDAGASRQSTRHARSTSIMRAVRDPKRTPDASNSSFCQPTPTPRSTRPPEKRVERRERLGQQQRRTQRRNEHRRRESDAPRRAGHCRECHQRLGPRLVVRKRKRAVRIAIRARADREVIGHRDLVDARVLSALRELDELREIVAKQALHPGDGDRDRKRFTHFGPIDFVRLRLTARRLRRLAVQPTSCAPSPSTRAARVPCRARRRDR